MPSKKGADFVDKIKKKPHQIILLIIYFIMFIPHIIMWAAGIIDYINGANIGWFSYNYVYGLPAMLDTMSWIFLIFIYIPVYEAAALYQGIYLAAVMNKYRDYDKINRFKKLWHIIGIASIVAFCLIYLICLGFENIKTLEDWAVILCFLVVPIAVTYIVWSIAIFTFTSIRLKTVFRSYSKKVFHIVGISEILLFIILLLLTFLWLDEFGLVLIILFFAILIYIVASIVLLIKNRK